MAETFAFDPDWVVAPGETLKEWREENRISARVLARACGMHIGLLEAIEDGSHGINDAIAFSLERVTQIPARLWLNLERQYRTGLQAGKIVMR